MPASARLNALAERKQFLVTEAAIHRQLIANERLHLEARVASVRHHVASHRWWWIGGTVLAGWLATRGWGRVSRWLPAASTILRLVRDFRG